MSRIRDLESRYREFEKSDFYDSKFVFTGDFIQRKGKLGFVGIIGTLVPLGFLLKKTQNTLYILFSDGEFNLLLELNF